MSSGLTSGRIGRLSDPGIDLCIFRMLAEKGTLPQQIGLHLQIAEVWQPMLDGTQALRAPGRHALACAVRLSSGGGSSDVHRA
jgi:hypothetical protein